MSSNEIVYQEYIQGKQKVNSVEELFSEKPVVSNLVKTLLMLVMVFIVLPVTAGMLFVIYADIKIGPQMTSKTIRSVFAAFVIFALIWILTKSISSRHGIFAFANRKTYKCKAWSIKSEDGKFFVKIYTKSKYLDEYMQISGSAYISLQEDISRTLFFNSATFSISTGNM